MNSEARLGTEKLPKLMFQLAIPSIIAQLINVLYNMVDRMYIGRLPGEGALALTGLGLCFPIIIVVTAFSMFAGAGGAPMAAIALGEGNREEAEKILGNAVTILAIFSIILPALILPFKEPLLYLFGASEATIGYSSSYLSIYLLGTVFVQLAMGLNQFIVTQGQARVAMFSVMIGAVLNIILDPIFIFALNMGVRGAATATIISQAVSAVWVVWFLVSDRSSIRIKRKHLRLNRKIVAGIAALGVSPFIMRATESLIEVVFNNNLQRYGGDMYVGSMTICVSVMQIVFVLINGFTIGVQPIVSYNYGAKNYTRVRQTSKIILLTTFISSTVLCILVVLFPGACARIFTQDPELIELVKKVLPIFFAGVWIFGLQVGAQTILIGLKQAKASLFLALLRKVFLLTPLVFLMPLAFGVMGIYWAEPISDIVSALTALGIILYTNKKLKREEDAFRLSGGVPNIPQPVENNA